MGSGASKEIHDETIMLLQLGEPIPVHRCKPKAHTKSQQVCSRCGYNRHVGKEKSPATNATCHKCNKKGHYSAQCFSKTHRDTADRQATAHELSTKPGTTWNITVTMNSKLVEFKLDTGAAVAISEEVFKTVTTATTTEALQDFIWPN